MMNDMEGPLEPTSEWEAREHQEEPAGGGVMSKKLTNEDLIGAASRLLIACSVDLQNELNLIANESVDSLPEEYIDAIIEWMTVTMCRDEEYQGYLSEFLTELGLAKTLRQNILNIKGR